MEPRGNLNGMSLCPYIRPLHASMIGHENRCSALLSDNMIDAYGGSDSSDEDLDGARVAWGFVHGERLRVGSGSKVWEYTIYIKIE